MQHAMWHVISRSADDESQENDIQAGDLTIAITENACPGARHRGSRPALKGIQVADGAKVGEVPAELQQCRSCKGHQ